VWGVVQEEGGWQVEAPGQQGLQGLLGLSSAPLVERVRLRLLVHSLIEHLGELFRGTGLLEGLAGGAGRRGVGGVGGVGSL
jgi:hypothetical protein